MKAGDLKLGDRVVWVYSSNGFTLKGEVVNVVKNMGSDGNGITILWINEFSRIHYLNEQIISEPFFGNVGKIDGSENGIGYIKYDLEYYRDIKLKEILKK